MMVAITKAREVIVVVVMLEIGVGGHCYDGYDSDINWGWW